MKISGQYRAKIGDSPIWHETFGVIWLDTANKKIITYNPETTEEQVYDAFGWIKALIPTADGQFIAVYKEGLYYLNFKLGEKKPFSFPPNLSEMHYLSDAKCGPDGQIWVGSADVFFQRFKETPQTAFSNYPFQSAKLFTINAAGVMTEQLPAVAFSGGLEWERKTNKFYHIDSSKQSIFQYQLADNGQLQFEKLVYSFQMKEGFPDGLTIDGDGNLYVALYKGPVIAEQSEEPTRIVCLNPVTKQIIWDMQIPVSHITSCTIGGSALNTLYVTTAYGPLAAHRVKEEPLAGYLLEIPLETTGVLPYEFESGLHLK